MDGDGVIQIQYLHEATTQWRGRVFDGLAKRNMREEERVETEMSVYNMYVY